MNKESPIEEAKRMLRNYRVLLSCAASGAERERFSERVNYYSNYLKDRGVVL